MDLYEVSYRSWNSSFSDLINHSSLSVGTSGGDAIDRFKDKLTEAGYNTDGGDFRDFKAKKIEKVMGYKILIQE